MIAIGRCAYVSGDVGDLLRCKKRFTLYPKEVVLPRGGRLVCIYAMVKGKWG